MNNIQQQIEELKNDLNAHRQGWIQWSNKVLADKTRLLANLLKQI